MIPSECGAMRYRIDIQSRTVSQDSYGQAVETWTTVAIRWGRIEPLSGRELWQAQQVRPDLTHKITMRYYAGLTPKERLKFGSRYFEVTSVLNIDEQKRYMVLLCTEQL